MRVSRLLFNEVVFAPQEFTFTSSSAVDLRLYTMDLDEAGGFELSEIILDIIDKVSVVGPYIVSTLTVTGSILSAFFTYAIFIIENWAILLMTFETFVLLRATIIMQGRGKQSKKIAKALTSIASDNKKMFEFLILVFTKTMSLVWDAVKAIGAWIPLT